jgi:ABC-type amino acid transport substrate-binding protein
LTATALLATSCSAEQTAAGSSFEPATPHVLTVATALVPAPGFWAGDPPVSGFEAGLAAAIAHHLGLRRVEVVVAVAPCFTRAACI